MRLVALALVAMLSLGAAIVVAGSTFTVQFPFLEPPAIAESPAASPAASRGRADRVAPEPGEFYVSTTGDDESAGTAEEPWRTLQAAVSRAAKGSSIYLRQGRYEGAEITRDNIRVIGHSGEAVIIEGTLAFTSVDGGVIRNVTIEGATAPYQAGLLVKDSSAVTIVGNVVRRNAFGIHLDDVSDSLVEGNEITDNASGIEVHFGGADVVIRDNRIAENNRPLDEVRSATGINFYYTAGPVTFTGNTVEGHRGQNIEIYSASGLEITENILANSADAIETGTDAADIACDGLHIARNLIVAVRRGVGEQRGFILRCASNSLVAHNTFHGLDRFAVDVIDGTLGTQFGGSIDGLRIVNNIMSGGRAYSIDSELPASVEIDYNLVWPGTGAFAGEIAHIAGQPVITSWRTFRELTTFEAHGVLAPPNFVDPTSGNYLLRPDSRAIDRGVRIDGVNDEYKGSAPDLGRYEMPPSQ